MPALTSLVNPNSAVITNVDANPASVTLASNDTTMQEIAYYLGKLVKMSEALAVVDVNQRQRVSIDSAPVTITANANLNANQAVIIKGESSSAIISPNGNAATSYAAVPEIWRTIELARQNYQTSIRSNLTFS